MVGNPFYCTAISRKIVFPAVNFFFIVLHKSQWKMLCTKLNLQKEDSHMFDDFIVDSFYQMILLIAKVQITESKYPQKQY